MTLPHDLVHEHDELARSLRAACDDRCVREEADFLPIARALMAAGRRAREHGLTLDDLSLLLAECLPTLEEQHTPPDVVATVHRHALEWVAHTYFAA